MRNAQLYPPLEAADLVIPKHAWVERDLFEILAHQFDYIAMLTEQEGGLWEAALWNDSGAREPYDLGVEGHLGTIGWTVNPSPIGEALMKLRRAAATVRKQGGRLIFVFLPGPEWLDCLRNTSPPSPGRYL